VSDDNEPEVADGQPEAKPDVERATCTPCGGTGEVISNLGGECKQVPCPWCEGTGQFIPGHDAQAHRRDDDGEPAA